MADFPALFAPGTDEFTYALAPISPNGLLSSAALGTAAWPSANLAIYCPIRVSRQVTVYKMIVGCGATGGGNFDAGIYTWSGTKLVSTGSTARATSSEVIVDVTDTTFGPGRFWLAMAANGTDNYFAWWGGLNAGIGKMAGLRQQATAFALPSTATFATAGQSLVPAMVAVLRSE